MFNFFDYFSLHKRNLIDYVALTGAGISKPSGIPTFEENGDIRNYLTRDFFESNPETFYKKLLEMKDVVRNAQPNPAHLVLAKYEIPIITMNVDQLHQKAGSKTVIEVHGNIDQVHCHECDEHFDFDYVEQNIRCPKCGQILQHDIILYGDGIPQLQKAMDLAFLARHLIIIGTSFYTSTGNWIMEEARKSGSKITIVNKDAEIELPKLLNELCKK